MNKGKYKYFLESHEVDHNLFPKEVMELFNSMCEKIKNFVDDCDDEKEIKQEVKSCVDKFNYLNDIKGYVYPEIFDDYVFYAVRDNQSNSITRFNSLALCLAHAIEPNYKKRQG